MRVLVASDDYDAAVDLEADLQADGVEVVGVETTARSALSAAKRERPEVAVVNSMLRSGPAIVLAERLLELGIGVVIATGNSDEFQSLAAQPKLACVERPVTAGRARSAARRVTARN